MQWKFPDNIIVTQEEDGGIGGEYVVEVSLLDNGIRELLVYERAPSPHNSSHRGELLPVFLTLLPPPIVLPSYKVCGLQSTILDTVTMFLMPINLYFGRPGSCKSFFLRF